MGSIHVVGKATFANGDIIPYYDADSFLDCIREELPWQRVVREDGSIAPGGLGELRRARLEDEGVPFGADGRVDMARCRWDGR